MKKNVKVCFWIGIGVAFLAVGICFVTRLTDPGYGYVKNRDFMEESAAYDVLFFGNSHMANAVFPLELWNNYGMTSYNLAGFGSPVPATYWIVKNALDKSNPRLVVVDCYGIGMEEKMGRKELLHTQIDQMPLGLNKMEMINDLVEEPGDRLEFIWKFTAYHDRWWDLDQADFEKDTTTQKGAEIAFSVVPPDEMAKRPAETADMDSVGVEYLRRIIEECQSRNIEILLTYLPFPAAEEGWQEALYAERIAQEYGLAYINFLELPVVDLGTDCSDKNSHLNGSGGRKVTDYIGQYIEKQYDIDDHRGEEAYLDWDENYRQYMDYKVDMMGQVESLDKYLVMLADQAFSCCIYVDGEAGIWKQNEMYLPLINNVADGRAVRIEAASGNDYLLIVDNSRGGGT